MLLLLLHYYYCCAIIIVIIIIIIIIIIIVIIIIKNKTRSVTEVHDGRGCSSQYNKGSWAVWLELSDKRGC